jgi:hypothetical protein
MPEKAALAWASVRIYRQSERLFVPASETSDQERNHVEDPEAKQHVEGRRADPRPRWGGITALAAIAAPNRRDLRQEGNAAEDEDRNEQQDGSPSSHRLAIVGRSCRQ